MAYTKRGMKSANPVMNQARIESNSNVSVRKGSGTNNRKKKYTVAAPNVRMVVVTVSRELAIVELWWRETEGRAVTQPNLKSRFVISSQRTLQKSIADRDLSGMADNP